MKQIYSLSIFIVMHLAITNVKGETLFSNTVFKDSIQLPADSLHGLTLSGYFDTYYFANLNNPSDRSNLGSSGLSRGFDRYPGQFQLGMVLTRIKYVSQKALLTAEIGYGPNVEYGSYGNDFRYKWGTVLANNTTSAILIKQAFIDYKPTDKLTITMGQFGTHIGYEFIDAPFNFHYSINNTFNAGIPFYHVGLKGSYALSDRMSFMGGIVNGTDNLNDNNRGKSIIGQLTITPMKAITISINTIQGNEANARSTGMDTTSYFGVLDFVATYQVSENFMLGSWLMYGSLKGEYQGSTFNHSTKHWGGANLYLSYKLSSIFSVGSRLEYFDNRSAARPLLTHGDGTTVRSYTLTSVVKLASGRLILKPEARLDCFKKVNKGASEINVQEFRDSDGNYSKNSQATIGAAAIFKF
jgi:hypothetical protein